MLDVAVGDRPGPVRGQRAVELDGNGAITGVDFGLGLEAGRLQQRRDLGQPDGGDLGFGLVARNLGGRLRRTLALDPGVDHRALRIDVGEPGAGRLAGQ